MKRQQDGRYSIQTIKLAHAIESDLEPSEAEALYHVLRKTVYGIPGKAIDAVDLVHALAELRGQPDPSGDHR